MPPASPPPEDALPAVPTLPQAPPPALIDGAAAIVWVADQGAIGGFRSLWVEPSPEGPNVVKQRNGAVVQSSSELFALAVRKKTMTMEACNDPQTSCNLHPEVEEPYLQSLRTGRKLFPWRGEYKPPGCDAGIRVVIDGAVGPVLFSSVGAWAVNCGAGCPIHWGAFHAFNLDTGKELKIEVPPPIAGPLQAHVTALTARFPECAGIRPYRVMADYRPNGELQGLYEYGDDHAGVCAGGQTCDNPVVPAPWIPSQLARYGRVPSWVAQVLARQKARHAFMVPASLAAIERSEFSKP